MSLKAKIEAVIYASEEPVTLAQLIGLLGEEGQAELDALASNQLSLDTPEDNGEADDNATVDSEPEPEITALAEDNLEATETPAAASAPAEDEGVGDADAMNAEVLDTDLASEETLVQESVDASATDVSSQPGSASSADVAERPASEPGNEPAAEQNPDARSLAAIEKLRARRLREYFRALLDQLIADYANSDRGFEVKEVASGFRFATKPEYHDAVRGFVKSLKPPLKLSLQALETLAVVAYKQPITAPEVSEIRGVESAGTLGSLLTRKLIATAGRKQVIGRPILYKTTKDFLLRFGLKDINELPSIEEFERMAGELNEAVQEEIQMEEHAPVPDATGDTTPQDSPAEPSTGGSPALNEREAVPEPTHIHHDTPEDLMADKSTHPEGAKREPTGDSE